MFRPMSRFLTGAAFLLGTTALHAQSGSGFSITLNGDQVAGDAAVERKIKRVDQALERADVRVQYDGLDVTPRLDLEIAGDDRGYDAGQRVTLQSAVNYPRFVTRGEVLIVDLNARGGPKTLLRQEIAPNGSAQIIMPEGENVVALHRVYDAQGRYDETAPLPLSRGDTRGLVDGVEDGNDATIRRRIPVYGGAVTVSGTSVAQGARVETLGESIPPDPSGDFVIQRILPPGDYAIGVAVRGAGQPVEEVREITIPRSDAFYTAQVDLTFGRRESELNGDETYQRGRIAGYYNGRYANGLEVTAQIDTGEGDLSDIFRTLDERDPRSTFLRLDPDDLYPTYGDDSTLVDDTPTSGKVYLRIERENNYFVWGDWKADLQGSQFLRNDRTLYGARVHFETPQTTAQGEPRWRLDAYGAQPDSLLQRDVFRGTGGSVYFLSRQDLDIGSETLLVQVRDATTGRVIETRRLVAGRDYEINYIQGVVTLNEPLQSGTGSNGIVVTDVGGSADVNLIVSYDYTPDAGNVDDFAYGARGEVWLSDRFRLGATYQSEDRAGTTQEGYGLDLLYQVNQDTFLRAEYARTDGPGTGFGQSTDGGLVFDPVAAAGGEGDAIRLEGRAALSDLGLNAEGAISAYWERRTAGFSTLDYTTTADETLWGVALDAKVATDLTLTLYYDSFEQDGGRLDREGGIEAEFKINPRLTLAFGLEHLERSGISGSGDGRRTDAALRLSISPTDQFTWFIFGQTTLNRSGTLEANGRFGLGASYKWANGWSFEGEVSDGDQGAGGRVLLRSDRGDQGTAYFGYELDPTREIAGLSRAQTGRPKGRYIMGGEQKVSGTVTLFGESVYDTFGRYRTLTNAFGVNYQPTERLSYATAFEYGTIRDDINGDFDRYALSLGVNYSSEVLDAKARIEYRDEDGSRFGSTRNSQTWLLTASGTYRFDEAQRLVFGARVSRTDGNSGIAPDSDYTDLTLGYEFRPVYDERLNVLLRYRYLDDQFGQQLDNSNTPGPVQRSHVFSLDADYDLNEQWTIGGKIGARFSESAADRASAFTSNDATLGIINARWHVLKEWDALIEIRALDLQDAGTTEVGGLAAIYRHLGDNAKIGLGYNFTTFSDDLTDLTYDEKGVFVNLIAKF